MNTPETRLKELLPADFISQPRFYSSYPRPFGHEFLDLTKTPPAIESLIRGTIKMADLGVNLKVRVRRMLIYLQAETVRGTGSGEGFVTVTEAERYSQAEAKFRRDYYKLALVTLLGQRTEILRREELLRLRSQLWQDSPWQPTVPFHPLVNVETLLNNQFEQLNPSRIGILVDDNDKTGITARIQKALIVNPTNLTLAGLDKISKHEAVTGIKGDFEALADRHDLRIWGNYWRMERVGGDPNHSFLYQVCRPDSFKDTFFNMLDADHEFRRALDRARLTT